MSVVEAVAPDWMSFDDAAAFLALPDQELARLVLSGAIRFEVDKRSPNARFVLRMDVRLNGDDVRDYHRERWDPNHHAHADDLINRAAMKFHRHPTRTSPGVRGPLRKRVTS